MASKKKTRNYKPKPNSGGHEPSFWMILAVIAIIISVALIVKVLFFPSQAPSNRPEIYQTSSRAGESLEGQMRLVASKFRCSCGGCGELPLIECNCDVPRGAQEEKGFIRNKLKEGLTVDQVIQLVDEIYGHRITR